MVGTDGGMLMKLELIDLTKQYGNFTALDNANITFTEGIYGILGANGAGKSTMMNLLTDNITRTGGKILFNGTDILDLGKDFRRVLGYMPQQQGFYENMTAQTFLFYMAELKGITNATFAEIDRIQAELDKTIAAYEEAKTAYESGEMEYPQFDVYVREANTAKSNSDGLDVVRRRAEELRDKGLERGFTPWLIEETSYESVYGDAAGNNQQSAALVALLALGLLLAGNMSYEQQSGMTSLLLSTMKGRRALLTRKILLAVATATGIWAVIYGLELHAFFGIYKIDTLSASVQNLTLLDCLPQGCTIGMFLIMLYALRLLTLICAAMVTLLLSSCMKRVDVSYIFVCGVLLLPSLLYFYVGLEPLKYLSFTLPMGAMSLVQTAQPIISLIVVCGVMIVLIGTSICLLRKKLRIKRKTN